MAHLVADPAIPRGLGFRVEGLGIWGLGFTV